MILRMKINNSFMIKQPKSSHMMWLNKQIKVMRWAKMVWTQMEKSKICKIENFKNTLKQLHRCWCSSRKFIMEILTKKLEVSIKWIVIVGQINCSWRRKRRKLSPFKLACGRLSQRKQKSPKRYKILGNNSRKSSF